jgi:hypothetical protein
MIYNPRNRRCMFPATCESRKNSPHHHYHFRSDDDNHMRNSSWKNYQPEKIINRTRINLPWRYLFFPGDNQESTTKASRSGGYLEWGFSTFFWDSFSGSGRFTAHWGKKMTREAPKANFFNNQTHQAVTS